MDKEILIMGAGAGTGVIIPALITKHIDPKYPEGIFNIKPSVLIPIVTGITGLLIINFTSFIGNENLKKFIIGYSFPAIIYGIMQQLLPSLSLGAQGRGMRLQARNPPYPVGYEGKMITS